MKKIKFLPLMMLVAFSATFPVQAVKLVKAHTENTKNLKVKANKSLALHLHNSVKQQTVTTTFKAKNILSKDIIVLGLDNQPLIVKRRYAE